MKIGVFVPNWIGDAVMATPTLRALRSHFRPTRFVGVVRPYAADVLAGTPWLDEQIILDPKSPNPAEHSWGVARLLRERQLDKVVLLTNSFRSAAIAWVAGARERIGYVRYGRGPLLTHKLYEPRHGRRRVPVPAIDANLQLAYALGCELESPRLELATLEVDELAADRVWKKLQIPGGDRVVVLNSGGAYGAAKHWPAEHFARLARRLVEAQQCSVLIVCGPAERDAARRIAELARHPRVVSLAGEELSIGLTKACIRRSRLLVTTDSGPRFFAVAFAVPVVTLFGPTKMGWSRTHDPGETCLQHEVPCGPCSRRTCPLGHHDCMRLMSVERVYKTVVAQLERERPARAA